MSFRRLTRSLSKTQPDQLIQTSTQTSTNKNIRNKKKPAQEMIYQTGSEEMDFLLTADQQLEAALNSDSDFLPECFQSQPRTFSSQTSGTDITFDSDLLRVCDSTPTNDDWKYRDNKSQPSTQLDMVNGIDQVMDYPSVLYSPPSSVAPAPVLTTAEQLLQMYLPSPSAAVLSPYSDYEDGGAQIQDDDLLNDLDSILSSYEPQEATLSDIKVEMNPPADTLALALCPQYEEGINAYIISSQSTVDHQDDADDDDIDDDEVAAETVEPIAGPSRRSVAAKSSSKTTTSKRGRKRKNSSDSDSAEARKKRQNAEAAKNYRKRRAEMMNKVFQEKEEVEKELEKARKKLQGKLNERNILLKMLYESYRDNGNSAPHKILFPEWIESWYQKQKDE